MDFLGLRKTDVAVQGSLGALRQARANRFTWGAWLEADQTIALGFALTACVVHFLFNGRYGYFRDELYYAACGQHLAWGYVDQAPLIAVVARLSRALFGDSLQALRFFPALASGAKILITGWIVHELGGRRYAQILAGVAMLLCPIYLTMDSFLSMNAFEPVLWMLCVAIAIRIVKTANEHLWLLFGVVAGIGILNKHSTLFFIFAFFLGLLVTSQRRLLRSVWPWAGALVAFAIFLPNLIWEIDNRWPTIEILRNVDRVKNAHISWLEFIAQQALLVHPLAAPICLVGLWYFLGSRAGKSYRFLGWTYVFLLLEFLVFRGRIYYLAPAYPMLFAAGSVLIEDWIDLRGRNWMKTAVLAPVVLGGLVATPLALPILPIDAAAAYANLWDVKRVRVESEASGKLPQLYADMMGWPQQAEVVAGVFRSLPEEDQPKTAILTQNYGEAGAIDYFGPAYGLPNAISPHNNYYLWGPQHYTGEVVISVGIPLAELQTVFGDIQTAAVIRNDYAIPEETDLPVYICRNPKMTLRQAWPQMKFYG